MDIGGGGICDLGRAGTSESYILSPGGAVSQPLCRVTGLSFCSGHRFPESPVRIGPDRLPLSFPLPL